MRNGGLEPSTHIIFRTGTGTWAPGASTVHLPCPLPPLFRLHILCTPAVVSCVAPHLSAEIGLSILKQGFVLGRRLQNPNPCRVRVSVVASSRTINAESRIRHHPCPRPGSYRQTQCYASVLCIKHDPSPTLFQLHRQLSPSQRQISERENNNNELERRRRREEYAWGRSRVVAGA